MSRALSLSGEDFRQPPWLVVGGCSLSLLTLVVDSSVPLGVAAGVPHVGPVLPRLWSKRARFAVGFAVAGTVLTVVGALLSPPDASGPVAATNRLLAVGAIWATALAVVVSRRLEHRLSETSREAAAALRASRRQLEDIKYALDQSSIVAITDQRGVITYANDKFCEISQYDRAELVGQDHRIVNSGHHPESFIRDLWRTIASGNTWHGEFRNRAKDGSAYWVDTTIVPFLDDRGKPYQYLAIRTDVTARKRAESQLVEQAALARLGEMAAVVAHEVRNPLAGIGGALKVIQGRLPPDADERRVVGEILERIDTLARSISDLLLLARPKTPRLELVGASGIVRQAVALLAGDPRCGGVSFQVSGDDVVVQADPKLLQDVLVNLLLNAAQAMDVSGEVRLEVSAADGWCRIDVADQGPGVPPEARERMFEPFFTTKHSGTGLGLSIARRVVLDHGGDIEVECPDAGGTTVSVLLPLEQDSS